MPRKADRSVVDDLLEDIRTTVDRDAQAEAEQLAAARRARAEADAARLARATQAARLETEARLESEARRQREAEALRQARLNPPAPESVPRVAQPAPPAFDAPIIAHSDSAPSELMPPTRGGVFYLSVVAIPVLCMTAIVLALVFRAELSAPQPMPTSAILFEAAPLPVVQHANHVVPFVEIAPTVPVVFDEPEPTTTAKPVKRPRPRPRPRPVKPVKPANEGLRLGPINLDTDQ